MRDENGKTIVEYDWTDIAKLNYDNAEMRAEMEKSMRFWLDRMIASNGTVTVNGNNLSMGGYATAVFLQ